MFQPSELVDADFHQYLYTAIKLDQIVSIRQRMARVLGSKVIGRLIK